MFLREIKYSTGSKIVTSEEVAEWCGLELEFITEKIGVKKRFFLGEDEDLVSLSLQSCQKLLDGAESLSPEMVQLLVLVTQNNDYNLPHASAVLQSKLSLPIETICFDVSLGCSGYVYALAITKNIMQGEGLRNAILVTCDPYSRIIAPKDRNTAALFSDAAAATWLSSDGDGKLGKMDYGTDGSKASALEALSQSNLNNFCLTQKKPDQANIGAGDLRLKMNGNAIFNFMMNRIPISIHKCLEKNNLQIEQIDHFLFHQASKFLLDRLIDKMRIDRNKVICNIDSIGNTVSSSIPIALAQLQKKENLEGKRVLISGFGVGLSWATNVIFFRGK